MYSLSIIIPLYNEEKRIFKSLIKIRKFINQNKKKKIEIIFVSDGSYGIPEWLIFGFPLRTNSTGIIEIIQGIELNEFAQTKIKVTTEELESERESVSDLID